jgi:hypothetical protein
VPIAFAVPCSKNTPFRQAAAGGRGGSGKERGGRLVLSELNGVQTLRCGGGGSGGGEEGGGGRRGGQGCQGGRDGRWRSSEALGNGSSNGQEHEERREEARCGRTKSGHERDEVLRADSFLPLVRGLYRSEMCVLLLAWQSVTRSVTRS